MSFRFSNSLATFQGYVNMILTKNLDVFLIIYLDDILVYTKDLGQPYAKIVYLVFDQLLKYGLLANLKKCHFYKNKIQYLDYIVSLKEIHIEEQKLNL